MAHEPGSNDKKALTLSAWIAIGAGAGIALGAAMGNLALWIVIGAGIGVAIGAHQTRK